MLDGFAQEYSFFGDVYRVWWGMVGWSWRTVTLSSPVPEIMTSG